jgi:hypothetical protein
VSCSLLQVLMSNLTVVSPCLLTQDDRDLAMCAQDNTSFADTRCVRSDRRGQFRVQGYAGRCGADYVRRVGGCRRVSRSAATAASASRISMSAVARRCWVSFTKIRAVSRAAFAARRTLSGSSAHR